MEVVKIIKKGHPIFAILKKVSELDKTKLSHKFKTHNFDDNLDVYVKCFENGELDLRGKSGEYRLIPNNR